MKNGDCFRQSGKAIIGMEMFHDWLLVHGIAICTGEEHKGERMSHAWIEREGVVFDAMTETFVRKEQYYEAGAISYAVGYPLEEAREMILTFENWGPWDIHILKTSVGIDGGES
ncbi:MAG: hypothetical protein GY847_01705 [Proteobacteria bacterium]|nr:hypothetical protein [Pseudomonadota bacterium]